MSEQDLTGIGELQALLGDGARFSGKLTFTGRVRIDGEFSGEIRTDDVLIIGSTGRVQANIEAGTVIVRGGHVSGDIRASRLVELHAPSQVQADILAPQVFMDKGVAFDGQCTMVEAEDEDVTTATSGEE